MPREVQTVLRRQTDGTIVQGSHKNVLAMFLRVDRCVLVSDDAFNQQENATSDLLAGLLTALTQLPSEPVQLNDQLETPLRRLIALAFGSDGFNGIPDVLRDCGIESELTENVHRRVITVGNIVPAELQAKLVPSMSVTFEAVGALWDVQQRVSDLRPIFLVLDPRSLAWVSSLFID